MSCVRQQLPCSHSGLLWLYCVRRFIGSFFFWVVRLGEGCHQTFLQTCLVCFAIAACRPAYVLARTCSVRMVTYVVDRKRDAVSDIRDELEMVMCVWLIDGFVYRVFFCVIGCVGAVVVFLCVRFFKVREGVLAIVQTSGLRRCARPLPSTRRSRCVVASLSAGCRAIFQSCAEFSLWWELRLQRYRSDCFFHLIQVMHAVTCVHQIWLMWHPCRARASVATARKLSGFSVRSALEASVISGSLLKSRQFFRVLPVSFW